MDKEAISLEAHTINSDVAFITQSLSLQSMDHFAKQMDILYMRISESHYRLNEGQSLEMEYGTYTLQKYCTNFSFHFLLLPPLPSPWFPLMITSCKSC